MNRLLTSGVRTGFLRVASRPVAAHSYVKKTKAITARNFSSKGASPFYDATMSSNSRYILFILLGAAVGEAIFGFAGDMVWEINNRGKLYKDIDWSKWESIYVEDEDDE